MNVTRLTCVFGAVTVLAGVHAASAQTIANGDFETVPTYTQSPYVSFNNTVTTASYTWTGYTGVLNAANSGGFAPPAAPSGAQVAFLQGYQGIGSSITQTITGFTVGQRYTISGFGAQRNGTTPQGVSYGNQTFNFSLFGTTNAITPTSTSFNAFTTGTFLANATSATFTISTVSNAGDSTAYLDKLVLNAAAPEPSSVAEIAVFALPALGLLIGKRRRRIVG